MILMLVLAGCDDADQAVTGESSATSTTTTTMIATASASPLDPLPQRVGTWTVETSVGTWEWNQIDASEFPDFAPQGPIEGLYFSPHGEDSWLRSHDGVTWTEGPIPEIFVGAPFLDRDWITQQVGAELWVVVTFPPEDLGVYRRANGVWRDLNLHEAIPNIGGMRPLPPLPGLFQAASGGRTTVLLVRTYGGVDWEPVYGKSLQTQWDPERATVELVDDSGVVDELTAVVLSTAVEFRKPESGELVHRIEIPHGVSHSQVLDGNVWSLLVDDGNGFRPIAPPWGAFTFDEADLVSVEGGFLLVANNGSPLRQRVPSDTGPFLWRSADGFNWESLGSGGFPASIRADSLNGDGGRVFLIEPSGFGGSEPPSRLWTSLDGTTWQPIDGFGNDLYEVTKTSFGWMMPTFRWAESNKEHFEVWVSEEGLKWESVPMTVMLRNLDGWWGRQGDLVFFKQGDLTTVGGPVDR